MKNTGNRSRKETGLRTCSMFLCRILKLTVEVLNLKCQQQFTEKSRVKSCDFKS